MYFFYSWYHPTSFFRYEILSNRPILFNGSLMFEFNIYNDDIGLMYDCPARIINSSFSISETFESSEMICFPHSIFSSFERTFRFGFFDF